MNKCMTNFSLAHTINSRLIARVMKHIHNLQAQHTDISGMCDMVSSHRFTRADESEYIYEYSTCICQVSDSVKYKPLL